MKISIVHPSRGRAGMALTTSLKWMMHQTSVCEYLLSIDSTDPDKDQYEALFSGTGVELVINPNMNAIHAINNAARAAKGDLIIVVSDDFDCPEKWDKMLLFLLDGKSDFVAKTWDGMQKTLITLPIMDRVYYERFGYIYYPEYNHMFCDQEMTAVAHMTGRVVDIKSMTFKHNHYLTGAMKKDAINIKNDSTWGQGEKLFHARLEKNFDLAADEVVKPYSEIVWR